MNKFYIALIDIHCSLFTLQCISQNCLPEGIYLTWNVITSIGGSLEIGAFSSGNPLLTSLSGLEGLTSIGGHLHIADNDGLTSLIGLDNHEECSINQ